MVITVLQIRDVYPGSQIYPARLPGQKYSGSRIRLIFILFLTQKIVLPKLSLSSQKYDPGCIPDPALDFLPIPGPVVKKAPDPDPQHWVIIDYFY